MNDFDKSPFSLSATKSSGLANVLRKQAKKKSVYCASRIAEKTGRMFYKKESLFTPSKKWLLRIIKGRDTLIYQKSKK